MAEWNPTMMNRNINAHGGTKTPKVFAGELCPLRLLLQKQQQSSPTLCLENEAYLGAGDYVLHLPYFLLVGWEEELLVGAKHL